MKKGQELTFLEPCHWTEGPVTGQDRLFVMRAQAPCHGTLFYVGAFYKENRTHFASVPAPPTDSPNTRSVLLVPHECQFGGPAPNLPLSPRPPSEDAPGSAGVRLGP